MNQRNRVSFFNILSTCLLYGISIFTAPLFSRLLGTGGYGNVSNYNVWVSVLAIAATMQTQGTLVNARVEYPEETQIRYQSSVMSLSFLVFAGVTALVLLFLEPISSSLDLSKFFILLVLFQAIGTYGVNFMNTKLTYELKAGRNMLLSVGTSLGTLVLSLILVLTLPKEINYYGRILAIALVYGLLGLSHSVLQTSILRLELLHLTGKIGDLRIKVGHVRTQSLGGLPAGYRLTSKSLDGFRDLIKEVIDLVDIITFLESNSLEGMLPNILRRQQSHKSCTSLWGIARTYVGLKSECYHDPIVSEHSTWVFMPDICLRRVKNGLRTLSEQHFPVPPAQNTAQ